MVGGGFIEKPTLHDKTTPVEVGNGDVNHSNGASHKRDYEGANNDVTISDLHEGIGRLAHVPIEELVYNANLQRISYGMHPEGKTPSRWFRFFDNPFGPDEPNNVLRYPQGSGSAEDRSLEARRAEFRTELDKDKADARRALRTASWAMMFFLITTDVIGPFNAPYAFSTLGYVGGFLLYTAFGAAALWSSFLITSLYLRLDSDKYPIQSYGDLMEVFYGKAGHYLVSLIQVLQILIIVGSNVLANAQGMTQLTAPNGSLCFVVSIIIWTCIGLATSIPFRQLGKLSWLASSNVFINMGLIFISMGFIAHSPPNYTAAAAAYGFKPPFGPVVTTATGPGDLTTRINGASNMVFGWSGLMIFVEFLNEMRNPYEFFKSFSAAQTLVFLVYIVYGSYVYGLQGQYTLPVAFQGVSKYTWQSIGNGLSLWTYNMASVTYLNIAVKVMYWFFFQDLFKGPPLMSRKGFFYWTALQTIAWWISFIIGAAIPQVQTIQGLVAAAFLLQFSYTWPPLMQFTFDMFADASKADGAWTPEHGLQRIDTWRDMSRWKRGLFTGRIWFKSVNLLYALAALATCALGIYGSSETIKATFQVSAATSFGCAAPV